MPRISPNNPVRRQLFPETGLTQQANVDNLANILKETIANDRKEKVKKWNFDFENEVPLEGDIEWFRSDGVHDWIGIKAETKFVDEDEGFNAQKMNEITPKSVKDDVEILVRKRRKDFNIVSDKARRKVNFD